MTNFATLLCNFFLSAIAAPALNLVPLSLTRFEWVEKNYKSTYTSLLDSSVHTHTRTTVYTQNVNLTFDIVYAVEFKFCDCIWCEI